MGRRTKETEADSKEKDVEMSAAEKLHIANFYADHCEAIEGKLEGASKNAKESRRDKAYSQLAAELTAMGVAVRTEGRVKKNLSDMKQKAKNKISKEKIERNKMGGGVSHARAMTPATQILADWMETSVASSGIPEAIDSNNTSSLELARKRMHLDDDNESTAMLNLDESVDEDNEVVQETPGAVQPSGSGCPPLVPHKSPPKKRTRRDKRMQYHSLQMRNDQQELINSELQLSKARLSLMQWKIAHKKLQVYTLTKGLTPAEVDEAYSLELSSEAQLLNGDF